MLGKSDGWNFLSEYDFDINHIKGKKNKVDDAISRRVHEYAFYNH
jgi:hypothetical protein